MKNIHTTTEIIFILDRSGSMSGRESDIIGGFNSTITKQKETEGECNVSTVLFNNVHVVLHNRIPLKDVEPITEKEYFVGGCTAYYDALGRAISYHTNVQQDLPEDKRTDKMLFIIMTDGYENASVEYTGKLLKKLIKEKQEKYGWEFIFMGAGIDAINEAAKIGIVSDYAVNCTMEDKNGIEACYLSVSDCIYHKRMSGRVVSMNHKANWKKAIAEDMAKRGR